MSAPRDDDEPVIDLESRSQVELNRVPGCDSDSVCIEPRSVDINEPHHRRLGSTDRELLKNEFPDED